MSSCGCHMKKASIHDMNETKIHVRKKTTELHVTNCEACVVSSPGRDSRDIRSSRLAETTQKPLGTNAL